VDEMSDEEYSDYAKRFLKVVEIVEKYQYYIERRTVGMLYLTIAASISIFLFLLSFLIELAPKNLKAGLFLTIFTFTFIAIWLIAVNIFKFPRIYQKEKEAEKRVGKRIGLTWFSLSLIYLLIIVINNVHPVPQYITPLYTQILVGLGNLGNYYHTRKTKWYPGKVEKEYLYFAIILLLTSPIIPILKGLEWLTVTIFALTGTYILGVYIVLTSDKALE
jgi:hypothetical protein